MSKQCFSFERLDVYKESRVLITEIYRIISMFPSEERFALGNQIRRAAVSITANIAEGSGRNSLKEKIHFIEISYGSLMEVFSELQTAHDLGYISEESLESLRPKFIHIAKMLSGLKTSFLNLLTLNP